MKPAHKTITYVVYPPNYMPADDWMKIKTAKNLKRAKRIALAFGTGAEIWRDTDTRHRPNPRPVSGKGKLRAICGSKSSFEFLYEVL